MHSYVFPYPSLFHVCNLWERQQWRNIEQSQDGVELKGKVYELDILDEGLAGTETNNGGTVTGESYRKLTDRTWFISTFLPSKYTGGQLQGSRKTRFVWRLCAKWGCVARCSVGIVVIRRQSTRKTALCACSQLAMAKRRRNLERRRKRPIRI